MKLSNLIVQLQEIENKHGGEIDVFLSNAESGSEYLVWEVNVREDVFGTGIDEVLIK